MSALSLVSLWASSFWPAPAMCTLWRAAGDGFLAVDRSHRSVFFFCTSCMRRKHFRQPVIVQHQVIYRFFEPQLSAAHNLDSLPPSFSLRATTRATIHHQPTVAMVAPAARRRVVSLMTILQRVSHSFLSRPRPLLSFPSYQPTNPQHPTYRRRPTRRPIPTP